MYSPVEVREALDVQHVHLVHEQHPRHQLRHALVDISVHDLQQCTAAAAVDELSKRRK